MPANVDSILDSAFTPDLVIDTYFKYKIAKWDRFSGFSDPKIAIPLGADGTGFVAFERQIHRHAKNISRRVNNGTYTFYPFREVDRPKDASRPLSRDNKRTLGIASIRDAIVQIILYNDVLRQLTEATFVVLDKYGPVSFAYRQGQSAPRAATLVQKYIQDGYVYVFDADLSKYFDTINHGLLLQKVASLLGNDDSRTFKLIRRFVRTDRTPYSSYRHSKYRPAYKIFHTKKPQRFSPKRNEGVPQGGVLSGMLANLYLHEFDEWVVKELGAEIDLKYVRYADDFIIMVRTRDVLPKIELCVQTKLESPEYQLRINKDKTRLISVSDGLNFVGFNFDGVKMRVREATLNRFKKRIQEEIFDAVPSFILDKHSMFATLDWLIRRINAKVRGSRGEERCPRCQYNRVGTPRSWIKFFQSITDYSQIRQLDKWIRSKIYDYIYRTYRQRCKRSWFKKSRVLISLISEMHKVKRAQIRPCLCDIKAVHNNVWEFASGLYQGRPFFTLSRKQQFSVPFVDNDCLQVSIGKRQYKINRDTIQHLWDRLVAGDIISRASLEKSGISSTSQIVALLSELPGIKVSTHPICLWFVEKRPVPFLIPRPLTI